jgi:hypothetical protein
VRAFLIVMVLAVPSLAAAERTTAVNFGGMFGGVEDGGSYDDDYSPAMVPTGGPRLTLSWENPPIALPPQRGYSIAWDFVPELTAGALLSDERGEAFLGVGARGELKVGQREGGLFRVNARMAFYLAARALVVGSAQDTLAEIVFGEYLYLGASRVRLGGEISVTAREAPSELEDRRMGVFASLYLGWAL